MLFINDTAMYILRFLSHWQANSFAKYILHMYAYIHMYTATYEQVNTQDKQEPPIL